MTTSTTALGVGQGILDKMAEQNDHPLMDSRYSDNANGTKVEQCWGTKGLYIASNASGDWETCGPFGGDALA